MIQMSRPYSRYRPPALSQTHPQTAVLHNSLCTCARWDSLTLFLSLALSFSCIRIPAESPARARGRYSKVTALALSCSYDCSVGKSELRSDPAGGGGRRRGRSEGGFNGGGNRRVSNRRQRSNTRQSSVCGRRLPQ
jgi:hypothetical protein